MGWKEHFCWSILGGREHECYLSSCGRWVQSLGHIYIKCVNNQHFSYIPFTISLWWYAFWIIWFLILILPLKFSKFWQINCAILQIICAWCMLLYLHLWSDFSILLKNQLTSLSWGKKHQHKLLILIQHTLYSIKY